MSDKQLRNKLYEKHAKRMKWDYTDSGQVCFPGALVELNPKLLQ